MLKCDQPRGREVADQQSAISNQTGEENYDNDDTEYLTDSDTNKIQILKISMKLLNTFMLYFRILALTLIFVLFEVLFSSRIIFLKLSILALRFKNLKMFEIPLFKTASSIL